MTVAETMVKRCTLGKRCRGTMVGSHLNCDPSSSSDIRSRTQIQKNTNTLFDRFPCVINQNWSTFAFIFQKLDEAKWSILWIRPQAIPQIIEHLLQLLQVLQLLQLDQQQAADPDWERREPDLIFVTNIGWKENIPKRHERYIGTIFDEKMPKHANVNMSPEICNFFSHFTKSVHFGEHNLCQFLI